KDSPLRALHSYLSAPDDPGGEIRGVRTGAVADLVLLDRPLQETLKLASAELVKLVVIGGRVVL
ncbi:hypothetical protein ACFQ07_07255, partial [Actinomadura adrarensis]